MGINDVVELMIDLPEENLRKAMRGVTVTIFVDPDLAFEVEFSADSGETMAEVVLKPEQLRAL